MWKRTLRSNRSLLFLLVFSALNASFGVSAAEKAKPQDKLQEKGKLAAIVEVVTIAVGAFMVSACGKSSSDATDPNDGVANNQLPTSITVR